MTIKLKPFVWDEAEEWNWGESHRCEYGDFEILIQKFNGISNDFQPLEVSTAEGQIFYHGKLIEETSAYSSVESVKHYVERSVSNSIKQYLEKEESNEKDN